MNLTIDIGNTFVKLAVFEGGRLLETSVKKNINRCILDEFYEKYDIQNAIYSTVRGHNQEDSLLKKYNFLELNYLSNLPLSIKYKTPETLGVDRIAAVVGALGLYEGVNLLVIDIGTCITYDFLNLDKQYIGGAIAPGFEMRFSALNSFTQKLPLVAFKKEDLMLTGNSTETSIISGVYNGMKNEIEGTINNYLQEYEDLKIIVTGGDRNLFDLEPKNRIFAHEFLVMNGLNEILIYNEK